MIQNKFHSNASKFLYNRFIAGDTKREEEYEEAVITADIARKIFDLRTKAGLTQQELAKLRAQNNALRDQLARVLGQQRANR